MWLNQRQRILNQYLQEVVITAAEDCTKETEATGVIRSARNRDSIGSAKDSIESARDWDCDYSSRGLYGGNSSDWSH